MRQDGHDFFAPARRPDGSTYLSSEPSSSELGQPGKVLIFIPLKEHSEGKVL
jgi:hypothetical protein